MNQNPSLWDRFKADTPVIFKVVQLIAVVLLIASIKIPMPSNVSSAMFYISSTSVVFAFFIMKDIKTLSTGVTSENMLKVITDIPGQLAALMETLSKPMDLSSLTSFLEQWKISAGPVDITATAVTNTQATTASPAGDGIKTPVIQQ